MIRHAFAAPTWSPTSSNTVIARRASRTASAPETLSSPKRRSRSSPRPASARRRWSPIAAAGRDRAAQDALGLGELAHVHERLAEVGQQAETVGVELRHQIDRPAQERRRRVHVTAGERPLAGAGQPLTRALAERAAVVVERPELRPGSDAPARDG